MCFKPKNVTFFFFVLLLYSEKSMTVVQRMCFSSVSTVNTIDSSTTRSRFRMFTQLLRLEESWRLSSLLPNTAVLY